jgi:hypothetical protein
VTKAVSGAIALSTSTKLDLRNNSISFMSLEAWPDRERLLAKQADAIASLDSNHLYSDYPASILLERRTVTNYSDF